MKHDINRWIFEIPLEDIQSDYKEGKGDNPCICCGKNVKKQQYSVHIVEGMLVSTEEPFSAESDMGFYPIGNSCRHKLPNNFYFKTDE